MDDHPVHNPKFDKFDYVRGGVGANAGAIFQLILEEGGTDQDVIEMARQFQGVIVRTAKSVLLANTTRQVVPEAPEFNSGLGHKEQPKPPVVPPNPFEEGELP